jgi:hypothetical protein
MKQRIVYCVSWEVNNELPTNNKLTKLFTAYG